MLAAILHDDFQSYFGVVKYVMNSVIQEIWQTDIVRILNSIVYAGINWSINTYMLSPSLQFDIKRFPCIVIFFLNHDSWIRIIREK